MIMEPMGFLIWVLLTLRNLDNNKITAAVHYCLFRSICMCMGSSDQVFFPTVSGNLVVIVFHNTLSYTAVDTDSLNPTCGRTFYEAD